MNEPLEFRSVTDLEELDALPDDAAILVLDGGKAKQISKENAKFGGGSVTKFFVQSSPETSSANDGVAVLDLSSLSVMHEDGSAVTAQEAYDAFMAGTLILEAKGTNGTSRESVAVALAWQGGTSGSGDPANVNFANIVTFSNQQFNIGTYNNGSEPT